MSLILCNEWTVDGEKNVTYFNNVQIPEFATGVSKKAPIDGFPKPVTMYEHKFNYGTSKPCLSTQVNGYLVPLKYRNPKTKAIYSPTFVLALKRRLTTETENKKEVVYLQSKDDIDVFLGLAEPKVVELEEVVTN